MKQMHFPKLSLALQFFLVSKYLQCRLFYTNLRLFLNRTAFHKKVPQHQYWALIILWNIILTNKAYLNQLKIPVNVTEGARLILRFYCLVLNVIHIIPSRTEVVLIIREKVRKQVHFSCLLLDSLYLIWYM